MILKHLFQILLGYSFGSVFTFDNAVNMQILQGKGILHIGKTC